MDKDKYKDNYNVITGICMRRKDAYDRDALHFAPFVLFPSPFPRSISKGSRVALKSSEAVNQPSVNPLCISAWHAASTFPFQDILHLAFDLCSPESSQNKAPTIHNLRPRHNNLFPHSLSSFPRSPSPSESHTTAAHKSEKIWGQGTKKGG